MSMSDRSEAAMTALVERVAEQVVGADRWAELVAHPDKYAIKVQLLPIVTATVEAIDAEPHRAMRGDEVERFIRESRDYWKNTPGDNTQWQVLDDLLDDYRLHADTGTLLHEEVADHG